MVFQSTAVFPAYRGSLSGGVRFGEIFDMAAGKIRGARRPASMLKNTSFSQKTDMRSTGGYRY